MLYLLRARSSRETRATPEVDAAGVRDACAMRCTARGQVLYIDECLERISFTSHQPRDGWK